MLMEFRWSDPFQGQWVSKPILWLFPQLQKAQHTHGIEILSNWQNPHSGENQELFGYFVEGERGCGRSEHVVAKA